MTAPRCADAAQNAGDPMLATAPPVQQWLLVEHRGPWGRRALTGSGLDPEVAAAVGRWVGSVAGRVALIRRTGRARGGDRVRRWFRVDSRPGREGVRVGWFGAETELLDVLDDPNAGQPWPEPVYLVCTHGRHDTCCAVRGRPVAAALTAGYPDRTWECTHVGGDRFAANLVVLPHGFYYGHLPPGAAAEVARHHDAGLVEPHWLRGRSSLPVPVQAAQHYARLETGDARIGSFPALGVDSDGPDRWTVRLGTGDHDVLVLTVQTRPYAAGRPLTCSAARPGTVSAFELVDLRTG